MTIEKMKMWLDAMENELAVDFMDAVAVGEAAEKLCDAIASLRQAIAAAEKENALQALHNENERLGLYKDAYAEKEPMAHLWQHGETGRTRVTFPDSVTDCDASWFCVGPLVLGNTHPPQRTEQEPVIDKSAAIRIATALEWEPKREWVGLTDEEIEAIWYAFHDREMGYAMRFTRAIEAKLKQKNGYAEENT